MLFGILLAATWLILLIRYPHKALPVSLAAIAGLALLGSYALWQQHSEEQRLQQIDIRLSYSPEQCSTAKPLLIELHNTSLHMLHELRWKLYIHAQGQSANLLHGRSEDLVYASASPLHPDAHWQNCISMPAIAPGYRATTLEFKAVDLRGRFTH